MTTPVLELIVIPDVLGDTAIEKVLVLVPFEATNAVEFRATPLVV